MATKITSPRLAIIEDGIIYTGWEAYPKVGFIDLPEIPSVPQPTSTTTAADAVWPWVAFPANPPTIPDFYEIEAHSLGMVWYSVQPPNQEGDYSIWGADKFNVKRYRKYKLPGGYVIIPTPGYQEAVMAYNQALNDYLVAIRGRFTVVGTHWVVEGSRKVPKVLPIPEEHILYNQTWLGKVRTTCLLKTYDLKIRGLLNLPV